MTRAGQAGEPRWLSRELAEELHSIQLARFGGLSSLRDGGAHSSAVQRPQDRLHYGEAADIADLAAAYAYGIAKNHPFADGNKRTAFLCMMVFLRRNGVRFAPEPADATQTMIDLAAGDISEQELAEWTRKQIDAGEQRG